MFAARQFHVHPLTLDELIARLMRHDVVEGIVLMGSTADALTPDSDHDLLMVVNEMPAPLHLIITTVDWRLTEVYVELTERIDQLITNTRPVSSHSFEGTLIEWLRSGNIVFDRTGRLQRAQQLFQSEQRLSPPSTGDVYRTWFHINYNIRQTRRMLQASDPLYHLTVDVRLLYTLHDLLVGYLKVRKLPWHGDKSALRYLQTQEPAFVALFQQCLAETDRERKFALYEQAAALTLAPVGGLWLEEATAVQFVGEVDLQPEAIDAALGFWMKLIDASVPCSCWI